MVIIQCDGKNTCTTSISNPSRNMFIVLSLLCLFCKICLLCLDLVLNTDNTEEI